MESPLVYLESGINRPDLYELESKVRNTRGVVRREQGIAGFFIIIVSCLIFITIVAWADALRSYIDSFYVDEKITKVFKSRMLFAFICTIVSVLMCLYSYYLWEKFYDNE